MGEVDEQQYRRGLYMYWKRSFLHPGFMAFDAPDRQESTAERAVSNTASQALVLLNDTTYVEAARVFAQRIISEGGTSVEDQLDWAFRTALSRETRPEERAVLTNLHQSQLAQYRNDAETAYQVVRTGIAPVPESVDPAELAAWTAVARAIFNLHEMIMRY